MVIAMTDKLKEVLINRDILVPRLLLFNYKKMGLSSDELVFLIYLINSDFIFNPKKISEDIGMTLSDIMECVEGLSSKGFVKVVIKKIGNVRNECFDLSGLYDKLSYLLIDHEEEQKTSIYDVFESEFGRTISPMEYQIIGAWLDGGTSEEIILLALKEATYNGVNSLRYIDKIISDWNKKGIKNAQDVENSKKNFRKAKESKKSSDILDYDWLNDE